MKTGKLLNTKYIFIVTMTVVAVTILSVWLLGLGDHHTIIENTLLSSAILSTCFFSFISVGLFKGFKLKDNIGNMTKKFDSRKLNNLFRDFSPGTSSPPPDVGDGIEGIILGIFFWIIATIIVGLLFYLFGAIIWMTFLIFIGMLYWIFFRALRFVFKKSPVCKGSYRKSIFYAIGHTIFFNLWVVGVILILECIQFNASR
jgi:hypothetical protein